MTQQNNQPKPPPLNIFFSYSHKDKKLLERLETHLALLKHEERINSWTDRDIEGGEEYNTEIFDRLNEADIILLLVSAAFMNSNYCYNREMKRAMERHEVGEARVIPIILSVCDWQTAPFHKLAALPPDGKPITTFTDRDTAFYTVAKGIRNVVEKWKK